MYQIVALRHIQLLLRHGMFCPGRHYQRSKRNPITRWEEPASLSLEERIAEARRIYRETGCRIVDTMTRLRQLGLGVAHKTIKTWVEDVKCEDPRIKITRPGEETNGLGLPGI